MTEEVKQEKAERVAREYHQSLLDGFRTVRNRSILYALLCFSAAIGFGFWQLPMMVFNACILGLIFLIRAFGAQDQVESVQLRSPHRLMPDLSVLRKKPEDGASAGQPTAS